MKVNTDQHLHILLIEDDTNLSYLLIKNLIDEGFETTLAHTGNEGLEAIQNGKFDLCLLDIMLPEFDGYELATKLHELKPEVPFIFLTARSLEADKLKGFILGADDYITKPFSFQELYYRIMVILRRAHKTRIDQPEHTNDECIDFESLFFDPAKRLLSINSTQHKLSYREALLLHMLLQNKENYVKRTTLLNTIWQNDDYFAARSMDVYVTRLRKLLKDDPNVIIENLYGEGYRIHSISPR